MRGIGYCKRRLRRGSNPRTYGRLPPVIYKCKYYTARNKYIRALCNVDYIDKVRTDMARNKNIRALYCHITSPLTAHGIKISVLLSPHITTDSARNKNIRAILSPHITTDRARNENIRALSTVGRLFLFYLFIPYINGIY